MGRLRSTVRALREARTKATDQDLPPLTVDKRFSRIGSFNKVHLISLCIVAVLIYLAWSWSGSGTSTRYHNAALSAVDGRSARKQALTTFQHRRKNIADTVTVAGSGQENVQTNGLDLRALAGQGVAAILGARSHLFSGKPKRFAMYSPSTERTLRFQVCNGMANQRLSIVYGILLAHRLGRTPVLPVLLRNGTQRTSSLSPTDEKIPFENVYDQPYFVQCLAKFGVNILMPNGG